MAPTAQAVREMAANYAKAWSSGDPEAVASYYAETGQITINEGDPLVGRAAIAEMAAGFYAEFPDLIVRMDDVRPAGQYALFVWTLEGKHSETGNFVSCGGWEEWQLNEEAQVVRSFGHFDTEEYDRKVAGG
ncbi:nuclear transport factor 2 family protein [Rhodovibrionaceae bacterium A322]